MNQSKDTDEPIKRHIDEPFKYLSHKKNKLLL